VIRLPDQRRADRRLFAPSCRCSPPCGGAQIIYSAAGGRRSVPHAGAVCPHYVLPLGYEHYDARVRCLAQSPHCYVGQARFPARSPGRPSVSGLTRSG